MTLGHPLIHLILLLLLPTAVPRHSPMTLFPPVGRMDVHVVLVLQGMALSAPTNITRDA